MEWRRNHFDAQRGASPHQLHIGHHHYSCAQSTPFISPALVTCTHSRTHSGSTCCTFSRPPAELDQPSVPPYLNYLYGKLSLSRKLLSLDSHKRGGYSTTVSLHQLGYYQTLGTSIKAECLITSLDKTCSLQQTNTNVLTCRVLTSL